MKGTVWIQKWQTATSLSEHGSNNYSKAYIKR